MVMQTDLLMIHINATANMKSAPRLPQIHSYVPEWIALG